MNLRGFPGRLFFMARAKNISALPNLALHLVRSGPRAGGRTSPSSQGCRAPASPGTTPLRRRPRPTVGNHARGRRQPCHRRTRTVLDLVGSRRCRLDGFGDAERVVAARSKPGDRHAVCPFRAPPSLPLVQVTLADRLPAVAVTRVFADGLSDCRRSIGGDSCPPHKGTYFGVPAVQ